MLNLCQIKLIVFAPVFRWRLYCCMYPHRYHNNQSIQNKRFSSYFTIATVHCIEI